MIKRIKRAKSKSKSMTSAPAPPFRLFGQPQVLEGEDTAAYDELLARICAAVKPADIIDEMLIAHVVSSEWDVLRLGRLKWELIRVHALEALEGFLAKQLEYYLYAELFVDDLAEILQDNLPEDQAKDAQTLARECAENEPEANDKVNEVLDGVGLHMDEVLASARARKAKELVQEYVRREPDAVTLVHEVLIDANASMDSFMADALAEKLDDVERIDRLTTMAESRRNASLNEIDRRRVVLGETLRRSVQEIEDGEFRVIEAKPAKGKEEA
jgi:predicted Zn-dependent protease with MMP-like domain